MFWKIVFWAMLVFATIGILFRLIMYIGFIQTTYKTDGFWTSAFTGLPIFLGGIWNLIKIPLAIILVFYFLDIGGCIQTSKPPTRSIDQEEIAVIN